MKDQSKTRQVLIQELASLRQRIEGLEQSESELKRASESLRESAGYFKAIIQNSSDIVLILDKLGTITYASPSVERFLGYEPEELIGRRTLDLIMSDDKPRAIADFGKSLLVKEVLVPNVFRISHKNGTERILEGTGNNLLDNPIVAGFVMNVRDITERKQTEEALLRSESTLRSVFKATPVGLCIMKDRVYQSANKTWCESFGYSESEIIGHTTRILYEDEEEYERVGRDLYANLLECGLASVQTRLRRKDGIFRDVTVIAAPLQSEELSSGTVVAIQDITDYKQATEELRENRRQLAGIIEFLPDATLVIDQGGRVIAWNRAIEIMTGVKAADMLGKGDYEYALPFYGERRPILIDLALDPDLEREKSYTSIERKGDTLFGESFTPHLPGGNVHLSATASVLRNDKGEIAAAIECIRDNTERKKSQEDLRQAEERYRSIFENAQEGIYRSTPGGRIIMANPAMANIFGYASPEELISGITDLARQLYVDPEERAKIRQIIEEQGSVRNYETQLYRKDGSIIWISMTMRAVCDEKGQLLYYEGMDEDITNRKESADRMRKALGATVQAIAVTVETRDPYTAGHQRRVADLARSIATEMSLPTDQIDGIRMAAIIHDLGKISVPVEILSKPTKLTALEFSLIKTHAQSGYDILKDIDFPWPIARIVLEHHERMNGSGYPNGLTGDNLLVESRILSVADVVESMASHRPYRPALGIDAALKEIEKNKGTLYDNAVADACLRIFREKGFQLP